MDALSLSFSTSHHRLLLQPLTRDGSFFRDKEPNFPVTKVKVPRNKATLEVTYRKHVGKARLARGAFVVFALTRLNITLRTISLRNSLAWHTRYYLRRLINSATTLYPRYVLALGKRSSLLPVSRLTSSASEGNMFSTGVRRFEIYCQDTRRRRKGGERFTRPWTPSRKSREYPFSNTPSLSHCKIATECT